VLFLRKGHFSKGILVTSDVHEFAVYVNISFDSFSLSLFLILALLYVLGIRVHLLNISFVGL
jgi:hypothetical protein